MIKLKQKSIYKDGGSTTYTDCHGNKYWLSKRINCPSKGQLFKGNINDTHPKLAIGRFLLDNDIEINQPKHMISLHPNSYE